MLRKTESAYDASWRELWQTWVWSWVSDLLMLLLEVKWQVWVLGR